MQNATRQSGMTMIETMVAMTISAVLILGAITVYNNARANYRTAENLARLQESLRFAADTLDRDIRLAGYWGRTNQAERIVDPAPAVIVMCGANNVSAWALGERGVGIDADDDVYNLPCAGINPRINSDVLVLRHVSTDQTTIPTPNQVQVVTDSVGGTVFSNGILPGGPIDPNFNQLYDVVVNAYYVSNQSKYDATLPSLRRRALVGTAMQDQEIIAGVENLQVQFGIDRNDDGQADGYVDADHIAANSPVVAVRLWMLVRGDADETAQGFADDNVYLTPDADGFVITPDNGVAYPASHRRFAVTKTILLKNRDRGET